MTINYFSAEAVAPTVKHPKRLRITNRRTGNHFYRPWLPRSEPAREHVKGEAMEYQLRETYTSPDIELRILWHDEKLGMTFFAVKERKL